MSGPTGSPTLTAPQHCTLDVAGMDCSSCAATVEKALRQVDGVRDVRVDIVSGRVDLEFDRAVPRSALAGAVTRAGYRVTPRRDDAVPRRDARLPLTILSGVLWLAALAATRLLDNDTAAAVLAVGAMIAGGWTIVPRGVRAALTGSLDMNFLMSLAAAGALVIGEHIEAASALFLFSLAQLLEARSMDRARTAIRSLMSLAPVEATVLRDGRELRIPADQVATGEVIVVRPGGKIALDGIVIAGRSTVDQSAITGESMPVEKQAGDDVFAGTLNGAGALELRTTKPASDTTLARIIHAVEEAQASRAPSQTFVDRFARVYTPIVIAIAVLLCVLPPLLGFGTWGEWFYRALVLLVVACPCALVISTPVTVVSALTGSARRGILIKGGLHLENAGTASVVAFDKTGTLTQGAPAVVDVVAFEGSTPEQVLAIAATAESRSEHPLARAVLEHARAHGIAAEQAVSTIAEVGLGVVAELDGRRLMVGTERLFGNPGRAASEVLHELRERGRTAVLVGSSTNGSAPRIHGALGIADRPRPEAANAIRTLYDVGIEHIVMLTGDDARTASAIGARVGISDVRAGLLPADKVAAVHALRAAGQRVIMVGDGVNDAPALAAADTGIAMGSAGTDVALETADIALMGDDLSKLPEAIRFARRAERIIRANIAFAILTKAAFVILATLGLATLWMAVVADMGASLLVIGNGLRALRA